MNKGFLFICHCEEQPGLECVGDEAISSQDLKACDEIASRTFPPTALLAMTKLD